MKRLLTITILLLTIASFAQGTIKGKIIDRTTKQPINGAKVSLMKIDSITLDSTYKIIDVYLWTEDSVPTYHYDTSWIQDRYVYTDSLGLYQIESIVPNYYYLSSFLKIEEYDAFSIGEWDASNPFHFAAFQNKKIYFELGVYCPYDSTKNFTECPNCHKCEGVRIQSYGLSSKTFIDDGEYYHNGFCVSGRCRPTKICMLCKTEF